MNVYWLLIASNIAINVSNERVKGLWEPRPPDEEEGFLKVPTTSENVIRCLCCTAACPTFQLTRCSGQVHCATGKSKKTPEMLGCGCRKCPVYIQYELTKGYYCIHGAAES
jgi:hypothetical protein